MITSHHCIIDFISDSIVNSIVPKGLLNKINNEWTLECIYIHDDNFILNQKKLPNSIVNFICECLNISNDDFNQNYTLGFSNVNNREKVSVYKINKGIFVNGFDFKMHIYIQFISFETYHLIIKQFRDTINEIILKKDN